MTSPGLLHRPADLTAADRAALLPAAASAGAQVRSTGAAVQALQLRPERPRALVAVGARADLTVRLLTTFAGPRPPAPVLGSTELPSWIGPLDVVVVLAGDAGDLDAARSADLARRRGATVVVRGAAAGPVAAAAGPGLVVPAVGVPEALAMAGRLSLLAGVAAAVGLVPAPHWESTADLLEQLALASHPAGETFVNPSVGLAEHLADGVPLLVGADPLADGVAAHGAAVLGDIAGVPASVLGHADAASGPALLRRMVAGRDIFADFDDDAAGPAVVRSVLISSHDAGEIGEEAHNRARSLASALPGAYRLSAAELGSGQRPDDPLATALGLVTWLDFAAVYLGLALGQLPPPDGPDGLARRGSARTGVAWAAPAGPSRRERDLDRDLFGDRDPYDDGWSPNAR